MNEKKRERVCLICEKPFPINGRQLTCSEACRRARQDAQLQYLSERRRVGSKSPTTCTICGEAFVPLHNGQVYCKNPQCKKAGLEAAIERQRQRREAAKTARAKAKEAGKHTTEEST